MNPTSPQVLIRARSHRQEWSGPSARDRGIAVLSNAPAEERETIPSATFVHVPAASNSPRPYFPAPKRRRA